MQKVIWVAGLPFIQILDYLNKSYKKKFLQQKAESDPMAFSPAEWSQETLRTCLLIDSSFKSAMNKQL